MVHPIKILIIEDDTSICKILTYILETEGFETIIAVNGQSGIQIAQTCLPDLIICDIVMPLVNGYEVLRALRQNSVTEIIPFIFLTGSDARAANRKEPPSGADEYLIKPITVSELLKVIAAQLQKQTVIQRYKFQGQYSEAEVLYKKALSIYQRLLGFEHLEVATTYNNLAELYSDQERYTEAELLHNKVLSLRQGRTVVR